MQEREVLTNRDPGQISEAGVEPPSGETDVIVTSTSAVDPPGWLRYLADPRHALPILLIVGIALYLVNLGGYPLYTKGEPREAVTVFDIVNGGGVILPQRAGIEIPSKPLMMHWLAAIVSIGAGSVNEFTVRLPSAALAIAGVIVCFLYVRRLFDDVTALIAALILATSVQYLQAATGARVDMTLAFFMQIAFFEFILIAEGLTRRTILLYIAIALAVLTKGPVGLLLPAAVAFVWIVVTRRWDVLRRLHLVRGAIVVLVLAGSWYVAAIVEGGAGFFRKQILAENLLRFAGGHDFHEGHAHRFYYMEFALMAGFMPWTLLLPIVAIQAAWQPRVLDSRLKYVLIWFITVLLFYNIPQSKRGVYLLCLYPGFATLLAIYVSETIARPGFARGWVVWLSRLAGIMLSLIGACVLILLGMLIERTDSLRNLLNAFDVRTPNFINVLGSTVGEHWLVAGVTPVVVVAIGLILIRVRPTVERLVIAVAAAMVFMVLEANVVIVPAIANTLSLRDFTDHAMKVIDSNRVGYLGALNYDVAFYSRRTIPIVSAKDPAAPDFLIGWRSIFDSMPEVQRSRYLILLTSNPTSLDGGDQMVLVQKLGKAPSLPTPPDGYIESRRNYDIDARRNSPIAFTSRGRTSADPPRRLKSQSRVISDS